MYCQFCGHPSTPGMNYCKQCGAATIATAALARTPARVPNTAGIAWAIAALGVGGLGIIFGTAVPLFAIAGNPGIVLAAMVFGLLALSAGVGALIRHMQRITMLAAENTERVLPRPAPPAPRYLDAGPAGMPSVTENTTRSFDYPVPPPGRES
jgi:hypothetical protein